VDFCYKYHLYQVNKIPTPVPEGELWPMLIPKVSFKSFALDFADLLPSDQKLNLNFVVLDRFSGYTYWFPVSKNINAKQTTQIFLNKIFTIQGYSLSIVSDRDQGFTLHFWQQLIENLQIELKMATSYHHQTNG
jgi:hypothetical protein